MFRILTNQASARLERDGRQIPFSALAAEVRSVIGAAVRRLPDSQRVVITLRDLEGWAPGEVCEALGISDGNQRVLLHRARSRVREVLNGYLGNEPR